MLKLEVKYVNVSRVPVPEKVRALLSLGPEHQELVRIERRRHDGGEPFSFTVNYLPSSIGDRIDPEQLHTVPLLLLLERDLKSRLSAPRRPSRPRRPIRWSRPSWEFPCSTP